jgi:peroxiredoxin
MALGENYAAPAGDGKDLIGSKPDEWTADDWINSKPLTLASLRGKVVLVRWWTAPDCPYCAASAPALNEFWRKYKDNGLVVVGLYHQKAESPLTHAHVEEQARKLGFTFPVAVDPNWETLKRWWLARNDRRWTSVTFLLDREGVIRHIHPGGAYYKGEPGYAALEKAIEDALASKSGR